MSCHRPLLPLLVLALITAAVAAADAPHPFLLWTPQEAADLRARLTSDPLGKLQAERAVALDAAGQKAGGNVPMLNLFKAAVLQDEAAAATETKELLRFIGVTVPEGKEGDPNSRNASWREDRTLDALRYDVLYARLNDEQRAGVERSGRALVEWCIANPGPWRRGDPGLKNGDRTGWLPNMQWPTMAGAHVWAVVLRDPALIERIFACDGGWKWYLDHYIADGRFYMEEFGKYYSNIGSMLLWCEGLERLGLGRFGWGYTGAGGATMRRFLGCLPAATLPRIPRAEAAAGADFPVVWMGDAGREWLSGVGSRPGARWSQARMNGAISKMRQPLWWELGQRRFPEDGYGWFLAQSHAPDEPAYLPSPYWSLAPIDPASVQPPPAPSTISTERGFALLRADQSPTYWTSPKPAVALQFGMYYVHYTHDCFSLLDFVAHNRLIYDKVGRTGTNYAGGDAWRDHGRGQASAVVVDELQIKPVDDGESGCAHQRIRQDCAGPARFVAVRAAGLFPDVDTERALVLCDDYLVDVTWLSSPTPRMYDWHVLSPGALPTAQAAAWKPVTAFPEGRIREQALSRLHLGEPLARDAGDAAWSEIILLQPAAAPEGDDTVGVRVTMLGESGTALIAGRPPQLAADALGIKVMATRTAPATCFAAVHEPLRGGTRGLRLARIARFAQQPGAVAFTVTGQPGTGIDDRIVIRGGDDAAKPIELSADGESLTVADHAWIRIHPDRIEVQGGVTALRLRAPGAQRVVVNGTEHAVTAQDGLVTWK